MVTVKDYNASARARAGAEALDQYNANWFEYINIDRMDLGSDVDCIIGQLYGEFIEGLNTLGWDLATASQYGLYAYDSGDRTIDDIEDEYDALYASWLAEIEKRKRAAA